MQIKTMHYIDGNWKAIPGGSPSNILDPSTARPIARIDLTHADGVNLAISAASAALPVWRETPLAARISLVERILDIYQRRAPEMAEAISREMGAPIGFALSDQVGAGTWHIEGFLSAMSDFRFEETLPGSDGHETVRREPVGVCGMITPWNWPMNQITLKVIPALLVGCTVVLKPSEIAPLSAMLFAEILHEAGCPAGVFNLINGDGPGVGAPLASHPDVSMVSFTGSTRAGIAVGSAALPTMKRVTLELGGKSPDLIFADCDLEAAVNHGVSLCMGNSGQSCDAPTRLLVERSVYDDAIAIAKTTAETLVVGPADRDTTTMGPLVSEQQFDTVQNYIRIGIDEGAQLVSGGLGKPEGMEDGFFAKPTVFAGVTNDMRIAQEEIFGPVLVMIPFDTEAEAIAMANDSAYGLAAYVNTASEDRAARVSRRLQAGMVSVNQVCFAKGSPFGGVKLSGLGREGGLFGLEDFTEIKTVATARN